jgi:hypothetical protein
MQVDEVPRRGRHRLRKRFDQGKPLLPPLVSRESENVLIKSSETADQMRLIRIGQGF